MEWAELDSDGALWTIPSLKMKRTKLEKEQAEAYRAIAIAIAIAIANADRGLAAQHSPASRPRALCISQ